MTLKPFSPHTRFLAYPQSILLGFAVAFTFYLLWPALSTHPLWAILAVLAAIVVLWFGLMVCTMQEAGHLASATIGQVTPSGTMLLAALFGSLLIQPYINYENPLVTVFSVALAMALAYAGAWLSHRQFPEAWEP